MNRVVSCDRNGMHRQIGKSKTKTKKLEAKGVVGTTISAAASAKANSPSHTDTIERIGVPAPASRATWLS